jgi:hypothetical protein
MSTKTTLKRLSLGTVVALGAGVLSLVSVSSANAAGYGSTTAAGAIETIVTGSTGLVSPAISSGTTTTATATLLSTGTLNVNVAAAGGVYVVSSGAYVSSVSGTTITTAAYVSGDQSKVSSANADNSFTVKPTGAAGSTFTITGYAATYSSGYTLANVTALGSPVSVLTVTIAGTSVAGVPSVANSYVNWVNSTTNTGTTADVSGASSTTTGNILQLEVHLRDAYKNDVTSTSGALVATVSTGATAGIASSYSSSQSAGTYTTAVSAASPADLWVAIGEATAGAGWSGTVTVTYNGVTIATKSGTITGIPAKIVVTPLVVAHRGGSAVAAGFKYQAYDAAGNATVITASGLSIASNSDSNVISAIAGTDPNTTTSSGYGSITGGTTDGTANLTLKYVNTNGSTVVSNSFAVKNGGVAYSYTAAFDKASYAPGDIATLKVTFKDSKGNPAATDSSLYAVTGSGPYTWDVSLATPQLTLVGTPGTFSVADGSTHRTTTYPTTGEWTAILAGTSTDAVTSVDVDGVVTQKFTVGTTDGSYSAIIGFPTIDSATTVAYKVASGGTSLNDVLKGIVSLIASINKQIAALAKLVAPAKKK